ncbi:MAG: hypothetical protein ISR59_11550 [Anaerolineales bacterium]|uniref:Uncharacterized protein n=1 Tax=Candidatus Desulfolinea nitratireducens TaxID=2841698 RepID=A0A8J6THG5_9CHLR|nr:hypothetical protein [Candidatus Desulfolinea nitratireducens]MBL6961736.1 hypothetical protein [Anaerolineales bacterium]
MIPQEFAQIFNKNAQNRDFFLITDFDEWDAQVDLRDYLSAQYPIYVEGDGYLVFDLR